MGAVSFYSSTISFLSGVSLFSFFDVNPPLFVSAISFSLVLSALGYVLRDRRIVLVALILAAFFFGGFRSGRDDSNAHPLDLLVGKRAEIVGSVCSEPEAKDAVLRFCFSPKDMKDRVLVTANRYPEYGYGDILSVVGKLSIPKNFTPYEGGPQFDYVSYLEKDGIRYTISRPKIEKIGERRKRGVLRVLFDIKSDFIAQMEKIFPEPESSILGGMLLGERASLPKDVADDFKVAGLIHVLVLSGYNVTIVAEGLMRIFSFLPRAVARTFGSVSIMLFALMTGASATTVRASIMALVVILARSSSRRYDISRALVLAAVIMVAQKPRILVFDLSFELSFLATLGIIYIAPLMRDRLEWVTERWNMRDIVSTSLGAQVAVFPLLMFKMGQVSLVSVVTNILVLPTVPAIMSLGFASVFASYIFPLLSMPLSLVSTLLLSYVLKVASIFSILPYASINMTAGAFTLAGMYLLYVLVLIRAWRLRDSSRRSSS